MKSIRYLAVGAAMVAACPMSILRAEPARSARITQIIRDVQVMSGTNSRAASVSDEVSDTNAVRTGDESRAELTFRDLTITRLGSNTIFSFNESARVVNLNKGAILVSVPRDSSAVKVSTAAVSAAISGGTAAVSENPATVTKVFVLEGHGKICSKKTGDCVTAAGGQFVIASPDGQLTQPEEYNANLFYTTSPLIVDFRTLANADLIRAVIAQQQGAAGYYQQSWPPDPARSYTDMHETIDQALAGFLPVALTLGPGTVPITTVTFNAAAGNWSAGANWKPTSVPNNNGSAKFNVVLGGGSVTQDIAPGVTIQKLTLTGGILSLANSVTLKRGLQYSGGTITTPGGSNGVLSIFGTSNQNSPLNLDSTTIINNGTYNVNFDSASVFTGAGTFNNAGTFVKTTGPNQDTITTPFNNTGAVSVLNGGLAFTGGGTSRGTFTVQSGTTIDFNGMHTFTSGTQFLGPDGNINFNEGGSFTFSGSITNSSFLSASATGGGSVTLILNGDTAWSGGGTLLLNGMVIVQGTGTFTNSSLIVGDTSAGSFGAGTIGIFNQIGGVINANQSGFVFNLNPSALGLTNAGTLRASNGGILVLNGGGGGKFNNTGTIDVVNGGALQFTGPVTSSGIVDLGTTGGLTVAGSGSFTQTAGTFRMRGGTVNSSSQLSFQGGTLDAHGAINAPALVNNGTIQPALGGNGLSVKANVTLMSSSTLSFQLGGLTAGSEYSFMNVNGTMQLSGKLVLSFANGFQNSVDPTQTFTVLSSTTPLNGTFSNIASGMRLETSDNVGSFVVDYSGNTITLSQFKPGPVIHNGPIAARALKMRSASLKIANTSELLALIETAKPNRAGKLVVRDRTAAKSNAAKMRATRDTDATQAPKRLLHSRSSLALTREGQRNR